MSSINSFGGLVSSIVMSVFYGLLVIGGLVALFSGSHPKTRMIRRFVAIGLAGSLFRFVYFAVPDSVWGQPVVPTERLERFSGAWWGTFLQWVVYSLGNVGFFAQQGVILYFWLAAYNALRARRAHDSDRPQRLYVIAVLVYTLIEAVMVCLYFAVTFFQVIVISSLIQCVCSLAISFGFLILFWNLRSALRPEERSTLLPPRRSGGRRSSNAGGSSLLGTSRASSSSGGGYGAAHGSTAAAAAAATPSREEDTAARLEVERQRKMNKIQLIATVCALANLFRGCVLIYQAVLLTGTWGGFPAGWWVILIVDYSLTEVFAFAGVLYILRKPPRQPEKVPVPPPRTLFPATAPHGVYDSTPPPPGRQGRSRGPSGSTVSLASSRAGGAQAAAAHGGRADDGSGRKPSVSSSSGGATVATTRGDAARRDGPPGWEAHGGSGYMGAYGDLDAEEEDEEDWGDSDYSLALEPTPTAPPAPIAQGAGRASDAAAVPPAPGGPAAPPPAESLARAIPAGGGRGAAAPQADDGSMMQAGSLPLEPVKESVESDSAFPAGGPGAAAARQ